MFQIGCNYGRIANTINITTFGERISITSTCDKSCDVDPQELVNVLVQTINQVIRTDKVRDPSIIYDSYKSL